MTSGEISATIVTVVVMLGLAFLSFKMGQKIADKKK